MAPRCSGEAPLAPKLNRQYETRTDARTHVEALRATIARIDQVHQKAGRENDNLPNRLTRAEVKGHWAEMWAAGLDDETWYYRVSDLDAELVLVAHRLIDSPGKKVDTEQPLLASLLRTTKNRLLAFERYIEAWLHEKLTRTD
jgi:hypothetical protein